MRLHLTAIALVITAFSGCSCDPPPDDPPPSPGVISVSVDGAVATIAVSGLPRALRALQVDVALDGGLASAVSAGAGHDLVEAGLEAEDGGAKAQFTVVVADSRRLPINNGSVARLSIDAGAQVTLRNPIAIDEGGNQLQLVIGSAP